MKKNIQKNLLPLIIGLATGYLFDMDLLVGYRYPALAIGGIVLVIYMVTKGYHRLKNKTLVSFAKGFTVMMLPASLTIATIVLSFYILPSSISLRNILLCFAPAALAVVWIKIAGKHTLVKNQNNPEFAKGFNVARQGSFLLLIISIIEVFVFIISNTPL